MKSKRIVYFDQNNEDKNSVKRQSTSKKNLSISKALRQSSATKHHKTPSGRISGMEKGNGSQKIRILMTKDGFIFEKKYMIYDILCTLIKQQKLESSPEKLNLQSVNQTTEEDPNCQKLDEDYLFLNLETNTFGITKGLVRHNFPIEKDNSVYIEVRTVGYNVENIIISNKKIEFVLIDQTDGVDDQDKTIIEPIKLIDDAQTLREEKLKEYFGKMKDGRYRSRSLKFCWFNEPSVDNAESAFKVHSKRMETELCSTLNTSTLNSLFQIGKQSTQRQLSKTSKVNNTSVVCESNKTNRQNGKKMNLNELMKSTKEKDIMGSKQKANSRKFLNDSGLSYEALGKLQSKQNWKKEDAYGLEELGKRGRNKTTQNEDKKIIVDSLDPDAKNVAPQLRCVTARKNT